MYVILVKLLLGRVSWLPGGISYWTESEKIRDRQTGSLIGVSRAQWVRRVPGHLLYWGRGFVETLQGLGAGEKRKKIEMSKLCGTRCCFLFSFCQATSFHRYLCYDTCIPLAKETLDSWRGKADLYQGRVLDLCAPHKNWVWSWRSLLTFGSNGKTHIFCLVFPQ